MKFLFYAKKCTFLFSISSTTTKVVFLYSLKYLWILLKKLSSWIKKKGTQGQVIYSNVFIKFELLNHFWNLGYSFLILPALLIFLFFIGNPFILFYNFLFLGPYLCPVIPLEDHWDSSERQKNSSSILVCPW